MICTECQRKIPSLKHRATKLNAALFDINSRYHKHLGDALCRIDMILEEHGFQPVMNNYNMMTKHVHESVGDGLWISASFYRLENSGHWEVVVYVN